MGGVVKTVLPLALSALLGPGGFTFGGLASSFLAGGISLAAGAILGKPKPKAPTVQPSDLTRIVRSAVTPRRIVYGEAIVSGPLVFAASTGANNEYLHLVVPLAGHEVEEIGTVYFNDLPSTDSRFDGFFRIKKHLGTASQTADSDLVAEVADWTTNHRLRGVAYVYVRLKWDRDVWPTGIPNIKAQVKGKKLYDPREAGHDSADAGTWAWSDNAALCILNYLTSELGYNTAHSKVDETSFIAAANVCDEAVNLDAGGTQARYTCNGVVSLDARLRDVMDGLLTSCAGALAYSQGSYRLHPAAADTSARTLTADDLRGDVSIECVTSMQALQNKIVGTFRDPDALGAESAFPPVTNSSYVTADGEERTRDIDLPFTNNAIRAQRIAKIHLEKSRQQIVVVWPGMPSCADVPLYGVVDVTLDDMGWEEKPFRVVGWRPTVDGGYDLELVEESSAAYSWSAEETAYDAAPNTSLPDPRNVAAPTGLTLESGDDQLEVAGDGTVIAGLKASWTAPANAFVTNFELQYKQSAATNWNSRIIDGGVLDDIISPVKDGADYDVRVRAININAVRGDWATVSNHTVIGKTAPPPAPDRFAVARAADGTRRFVFGLDSQPADVRVGGGFEIRYQIDTGVAVPWDSLTALHTNVLQSSPYETNELAAGDYIFELRTVDSSGNYSSTGLRVSATLQNPRLENKLLDRNEFDLGWPGTITDGWVDTDGILRATAAEGWEDVAGSWDDLSGVSWNTILAANSPLVYETPEIDLGADFSFLPLISVSANGALLIEVQTGTAADGSTTGSWGEAAQVTARYIKVRLTVTGDKPNISGLVTVLDGDLAVSRQQDVDTSSGSNPSWFESIATGHFKIAFEGDPISKIVTAQLAINGSNNYSWSLVSKNATIGSSKAAEFKIYNSSGGLVDATVDVTLYGAKQ